MTAAIDSGRLRGKELAEVYRYRGIAFSRLNQNERALEDFDKAIELDQLNPEYYEDRAITYLKLRDLSRAQTDLAMALGLDSKRPIRASGRGPSLASYRSEHARAARSFAMAMDMTRASAWCTRRSGCTSQPCAAGSMLRRRCGPLQRACRPPSGPRR